MPALENRPCARCAAPTTPSDRFCGVCGTSVAERPSHRAEDPPRTAAVAAFFLGGLWTVLNPLVEKGASVVLARVMGLVWAVLAVITAMVWGSFFLRRGSLYDLPIHLSASARVDTLMSWLGVLLAATAAVLVSNIPLAKRAARFLEPSAWGRQRRQARVGMAVVCALSLVAGGTLLNEEMNTTLKIKEKVAEIRAFRRQGRALPEDFNVDGLIILDEGGPR